MNRIALMGRLTRDPEVKYTQSGKVKCTFTLAVDRMHTNAEGQREADFIPIVTWGKTAEMCGNNLTKGRRVALDGRLQIRDYEAKDGSGKRYVAEVIAGMIYFADDKKSAANTQQQAPSGTPSSMDGFGSPVAFDEEMPF